MKLQQKLQNNLKNIMIENSSDIFVLNESMRVPEEFF
jgi:hypothetical protein